MGLAGGVTLVCTPRMGSVSRHIVFFMDADDTNFGGGGRSGESVRRAERVVGSAMVLCRVGEL